MIRPFTWAARLPWIYRHAIGILLILTVAFILAMGCYALYAVVAGAFPVEHRPVPMYEVLSIVLAISAIGIAAFGWGVYRILSAAIEANVQKGTERSLWLARVKQTVDTGWLYWHLYQMSSGKPAPTRQFYLLHAIQETKQAFEWIHNYLDENERPVEKMLVVIRNNWAYYIYEHDLAIKKVGQADKAVALECVAYLERRVSIFPDLSDEISDTITKVAARFRATTS